MRLKVPYNYSEIDNFKEKLIQPLVTKKDWLIAIALERSHCLSSNLRKTLGLQTEIEEAVIANDKRRL